MLNRFNCKKIANPKKINFRVRCNRLILVGAILFFLPLAAIASEKSNSNIKLHVEINGFGLGIGSDYTLFKLLALGISGGTGFTRVLTFGNQGRGSYFNIEGNHGEFVVGVQFQKFRLDLGPRIVEVGYCNFADGFCKVSGFAKGFYSNFWLALDNFDIGLKTFIGSYSLADGTYTIGGSYARKIEFYAASVTIAARMNFCF